MRYSTIQLIQHCTYLTFLTPLRSLAGLAPLIGRVVILKEGGVETEPRYCDVQVDGVRVGSYLISIWSLHSRCSSCKFTEFTLVELVGH